VGWGKTSQAQKREKKQNVVFSGEKGRKSRMSCFRIGRRAITTVIEYAYGNGGWERSA